MVFYVFYLQINVFNIYDFDILYLFFMLIIYSIGTVMYILDEWSKSVLIGALHWSWIVVYTYISIYFIYLSSLSSSFIYI